MGSQDLNKATVEMNSASNAALSKRGGFTAIHAPKRKNGICANALFCMKKYLWPGSWMPEKIPKWMLLFTQAHASSMKITVYFAGALWNLAAMKNASMYHTASTVSVQETGNALYFSNALGRKC